MSKLKDFLLTEKDNTDTEDYEAYWEEDMLTSFSEFVDMLDDKHIDDEIEKDINSIYDLFISILEKLDFDKLSDEEAEHLESLLDGMDLESEDLEEAVKKRMIRKGKVIKRLPPRKGYKIKGNRYVRVDPTEKKKRSRGAIRGARKSRMKAAKKLRTMKKSLRKRKARNL